MQDETILTLLFAGMGVMLVFVSSMFMVPDVSRITGATTLAVKNNSGVFLGITVLLAISGLILVARGMKRNITQTTIVSTGDSLTDYINHAKSTKKSHYQIKTELISVGWAEEEINKRLN
jgi:uncharacterized membrane protein YozB (DUF420 family)